MFAGVEAWNATREARETGESKEAEGGPRLGPNSVVDPNPRDQELLHFVSDIELILVERS
jgi:hypothetical protein